MRTAACMPAHPCASTLQDDEGIVYNVREATRDAVVAFASARGGQQLYKNAHAVRTQYARASAELYVTKQAQAGLTRSDLQYVRLCVCSVLSLCL